MDNKFNLTKEENVFIARRNMVEYIFNAAKLEGMEITFAQVQVIVDGITVQGVSVKDTIAIYNLKRVWHFIVDENTLSLPIDLELANRINEIICSCSEELTVNAEINTMFDSISKISKATELAIQSLLFIISSNMFSNRNLTTGIMLANQIMVANGAGIISIPTNLQADFLSKTDEIYCSKDNTELAGFLYENCIDGIHLDKVR